MTVDIKECECLFPQLSAIMKTEFNGIIVEKRCLKCKGYKIKKA